MCSESVPCKLDAIMRYVMTFALEGTVADMLELLLEYGAEEVKEEKLRWLICQDAANLAHHRREAFYEDDRNLSPCGAAMERANQ